jgi:hypothetical protein
MNVPALEQCVAHHQEQVNRDEQSHEKDETVSDLIPHGNVADEICEQQDVVH